jgi:hypothetical protein
MVPTVGLEPTRLAALAPQASVSTNSTTSAISDRASRLAGRPHFGVGAGAGVGAVLAGGGAGGGVAGTDEGEALPVAGAGFG